MRQRYFLYDPNDGIAWFETMDACLAAAQDAIEAYRPTDGDYWPTEEVEALRVGMVTHSPQQVNLRPRTEADPPGTSDDARDWMLIDYLCDYELLPVAPDTHAGAEGGMSDIEYSSRLALAEAYARWRTVQGLRPLNLIAYMRALGLKGI